MSSDQQSGGPTTAADLISQDQSQGSGVRFKASRGDSCGSGRPEDSADWYSCHDCGARYRSESAARMCCILEVEIDA
jgi:hypothetical protein